MKKLTTLLFVILITTPVFAIEIDANTPIKWNPLVVEDAYEKTIGNKCNGDKNGLGGFLNYTNGWNETKGCSVSQIVWLCSNLCKSEELCTKFGEQLVVSNNLFAELAGFDFDTASKETCSANPLAVWVEKTQACVPINPCGDKKYSKAYCKGCLRYNNTVEYCRKWAQRYAKKLLHTEISDVFARPRFHFCGVKTVDGDYFVFYTGGNFSENKIYQISETRVIDHKQAFEFILEEMDMNKTDKGFSYLNGWRWYSDEYTEEECVEVVNFVSSLYDSRLKQTYENGRCVIELPDDTVNGKY